MGLRKQVRIEKAPPSSDWGLQPDPTKLDAVNTFPGLVHTARQAMKAGGA